MPIDGHPPQLPLIGSLKCVPCRSGDHRSCRDVWVPNLRRAYPCECAGPLGSTTPTCLPEKP